MKHASFMHKSVGGIAHCRWQRSAVLEEGQASPRDVQLRGPYTCSKQLRAVQGQGRAGRTHCCVWVWDGNTWVCSPVMELLPFCFSFSSLGDVACMAICSRQCPAAMAFCFLETVWWEFTASYDTTCIGLASRPYAFLEFGL